jgi:hypothetical protein
LLSASFNINACRKRKVPLSIHKVNQHKKRIAAFLLLGVFLCTLLHNVVPHYHHSHSDDSPKTDLAEVQHSHADSHSHSHSHDSKEKQDGTRGLLDVLGNHTHEFHTHDPLVLVTPAVQKVNKPIRFALYSNTRSLEIDNKLLSASTFPPFTERRCISIFPRSVPLRGPPSLV